MLEVLVAMSILSITMLAVIKTANSSVNGLSHLQQRTFSQWVAANQLTRLQLDEEQLQSGKFEGTEFMAGRKWGWTQTIEKTRHAKIFKVHIEAGMAEDDHYLSSMTAYLRQKP